jgi:hypothetical protein
MHRYMKTTSIKSHRLGKSYQKNHFFILNKGNNSGKPLTTPCPNCFVLEFDNEEEKERIYWLTFGLWRSNAFHLYLRGSVIPFITIHDARKCIENGKTIAEQQPNKFHKSVKSLRSLEDLETQFKRNLQLIEEAKKMIFYRYILHR